MLYAPRDGGMWDTWMFRHEDTFHLFYLQSEPERTWPKIGHATSTDMTRWTEQEPVLHAGTGSDWDVGPLGTGMVFPFQGRFYMAYCALGEGARQIGMAVSDDLFHWDKLPDNPVLVAGPPYESVPSDTCRGRVSWRDAYLFTTGLDDYVYATLCARVLNGPRAYRGAVGLARSRDLLHWELLPPLCHPGRWLDMEVPEVFPMEGRWWMLFAAAFIYTNHRDTPRMPQCGGAWQMVADAPLGPYAEPDDNLLLGSSNGRFDNYVGRHITAGDEHLLYYQMCGDPVMAAVPKRLDVRGDRLVPLYWPGLDALKGECVLDRPALGRSAAATTVPDADWQLNDGVVSVDVQGCSARRLDVEVGDCMIEARLEIEHGSGAGLLWRVADTGPKAYEGVWLDAQRARFAAVADGFNSFWPLLKVVDASHTPIERGRRYHVRVMVRGPYTDLYLDDVLHLSLSLGEPTRGQIGLFALDGRVRFTELTVHALR